MWTKVDKWTYCPISEVIYLLLDTNHRWVSVLLLCLESVSCFCADTGGAVETWRYHLLLGELLKKQWSAPGFFPQNIDISHTWWGLNIVSVIVRHLVWRQVWGSELTCAPDEIISTPDVQQITIIAIWAKKKAKMSWSDSTSWQVCEETQVGSFAKARIFQNNHKTENDTIKRAREGDWQRRREYLAELCLDGAVFPG